MGPDGLVFELHGEGLHDFGGQYSAIALSLRCLQKPVKQQKCHAIALDSGRR